MRSDLPSCWFVQSMSRPSARAGLTCAFGGEGRRKAGLMDCDRPPTRCGPCSFRAAGRTSAGLPPGRSSGDCWQRQLASRRRIPLVRRVGLDLRQGDRLAHTVADCPAPQPTVRVEHPLPALLGRRIPDQPDAHVDAVVERVVLRLPVVAPPHDVVRLRRAEVGVHPVRSSAAVPRRADDCS